MFKKHAAVMILVMVFGILLLCGCGTTSNESTADEDDSIRTYTSSTISNFMSDDNDGELVKIKDLTVKDGMAQYPGSLSSYIVNCENNISLTEGSTVSIVGNVTGYGLENLDIILGLSNCQVK